MNLYAVVITRGEYQTRPPYNPRWGIVRNKRRAIRLAKEYGRTQGRTDGAQVWTRHDVPEISAWDWPTFKIGATRIL